MQTSVQSQLPQPRKLLTGEAVVIRLLTPEDTAALTEYLQNLSEASKRRFGPHSFEPSVVSEICRNAGRDGVVRLVATTGEGKSIIGYVLLLLGVLAEDQKRYAGYGVELHPDTDATLAPSVADAYQGKGLGNAFMQVVLGLSRSLRKRRMVLWLGVQATNEKAVKYYRKAGFESVGQFEDHNGLNYDMTLSL